LKFDFLQKPETRDTLVLKQQHVVWFPSWQTVAACDGDEQTIANIKQQHKNNKQQTIKSKTIKL
jgi:hypothetical protein